MPYAIMRCKKLKNMGSVAASLQHCFRERETPNADPELTQYNSHYGATTTDQAMGKLRSMLPEKRRKDAVVAVEYVMTASPEWWKTAPREQQQEFFDHSIAWLRNKYGKDRVFSASIHVDEATPHLSAFVVPLTQDGRLAAKDFIGSAKILHEDQTTFAKTVEHLGLERGIQGSKATHQRVKSFYGQISLKTEPQTVVTAQDVEPQTLKSGLFSKEIETPEDIAERLNQKMKAAYSDTVKTAKFVHTERKKKKEAEYTAKNLNARIQPILEQINGMGKSTIDVFMQSIKHLAYRLKADQQEKEIAAKVEKERKRQENSLYPPIKRNDRGGYER